MNSESAIRGCHNVSRGHENVLEAVVFKGNKSVFVESVRVLVEECSERCCRGHQHAFLEVTRRILEAYRVLSDALRSQKYLKRLREYLQMM